MNGSPFNNLTGNREYVKSYMLLFILCSVFLGSFYGKVILHPNDYMFNTSGDGIKNYYVYAYYIQDNHSYTSFEGHNYPFGESVLYTDGHPLLAVCIKLVSEIFPGVSAYSIGILNFWMLISFVLCASFLFLIFRELKVYPLLSAPGAFSIMVLAPQVFRMTGHYALSYGFVIPLTLYLLFRYQRPGKNTWCLVVLAFHNTCCFFTHPYLGLISTALVFLFVFVKWVLNVRNREFYSLNTAGLLLSSILPLILFYAIAKLLDTHTGRTTNPYGFFEYYADIDTLFLPHHPPFRFLVKKILPPFTQTWEGWSYLGVTGIITCFVLVFLAVKMLLHKKRRIAFLKDNETIVVLFIASLALVVFSMGIPFRFLPENYLDHFSFLKQFRSIGRFAWVFFFMINILSIFLLDRFLKTKTILGNKWMLGLIVVVLSFIFFEGYFYHVEVSNRISGSGNVYTQKFMPGYITGMKKVMKPNEYQAIIPLPYYNTGSENFMKEGTDKIYSGSMILSFYTGIPLMGNLIPRSSICESKMLIQMFADDFYRKEINTYIKSGLPFLVLYSKETLNRNEKLLLEKGNMIYEDPEYILYRVTREDIFKYSGNAELAEFDKLKNHLYKHAGFLTTDTFSYFFYDGFENVRSGKYFRGTGGMQTRKNEYTVLADIYSDRFTPGKKYKATFWIFNEGENCGQDILTNLDFTISHSANGHLTTIATIKPQTSMVITGSWSLVELPFEINVTGGSIQFALGGKDLTDRTLFVDEVFIYPEDASYYRIEEQAGEKTNVLFYNNHRVAR